MKTYKSSALTHQRAEVLKEARENGVIIQECNTNGDVRCEYVLLNKSEFKVISERSNEHIMHLSAGMIDKG